MEFYICIKEFQLKIATLNIDWFKKTKALKRIIQEEINKQDLDFLIVNENIESFSFDFPEKPEIGQLITVHADDKTFQAKLRFDSQADLEYYENGGILQMVIKKKVLDGKD